MKIKNLMLLLLVIGAFTSCEEKIDFAKEATAIKAVFEAEKDAYLRQDFAAHSSYWVQEPTSQKIWQSATSETAIVGWENIRASHQKEIADSTWDRKLMHCTLSDFKIDIMDESAWVTSKTHWKGTMNGKPFEANQSRVVVMKKIDGNWKFALMSIYNFPIDEKVASPETASEATQIELHKQFIGEWKCESAKDTTIFWNVKPYGSGLECDFKFVSKGKTTMEGKVLWGYNKTAGKFTMGEMIKGIDNTIYSSWFDTKNTCIMKSYGPVPNAANDRPWWNMEFKTPDTFVNITMKYYTPTKTETWTRVK